MATKFYNKHEKTWYIKYKDIDGKWKNKSCGKNATASDAEIIRKKYDAVELNNRHKICVRIVDTGIIDQLKIYRDTEITKSKTGLKKSTKSVQRYQAIVNSFIQYLEEKGKERYSDITERDITEFIDLLINQNRSTSSSNVAYISPGTISLNRSELSKSSTCCSSSSDNLRGDSRTEFFFVTVLCERYHEERGSPSASHKYSIPNSFPCMAINFRRSLRCTEADLSPVLPRVFFGVQQQALFS